MRRVAQLAAVSMFALVAAGVAAEAEDLNSALGQAYLGNPTLDAARAQLRGTEASASMTLGSVTLLVLIWLSIMCCRAAA